VVTKRTFALLDRDGTIIVERNYLYDPAQVELLPGAVSGMLRLMELGIGLAVITNQSAIGRGYIDEISLELIHKRFFELLKEAGVSLEGIYFCPHTPEDNCECRKPGIKLINRAAMELGFDPRECYVIGDKNCDIEMGRRVGATTLLVLTGYGKETIKKCILQPDFVANDLKEAAGIIERLGKHAVRC
jgi:D-glycero-D-manno-heptose 1,7-bisphosphate phosphatase